VDLVDVIYEVTASFPNRETYVLSAQLRRAANSIPSDIAEGRGRHTKADYRHFLYMARGGTQEVETQIEIARRQKFITSQRAVELISLVHEVGKLINSLISSVNREEP